MLNKLRNNPWPTSLLAFLLYLTWFLVSGFVNKPGNAGGDQSAPPVSEIEYLVAQLPNQIGLIILLTGIVALLIWWKQVGFRKHESKSLKFIIPPLLFTALFFTLGVVMGTASGTGFLGTTSSKQLLLVILVALMVGYTEETMFRGILFFGAISRFKAVWGAIISSLVFGSMHFINLLQDQGFGVTVSQVVHAASDGLMYAALRLMTGSLWPVMLLHGLWDLSVSGIQTATQASGGELAQALTDVQIGGVSISPMQILPGLLYGLFVLWRWSKRNKEN